jgi:hypothetical protein
MTVNELMDELRKLQKEGRGANHVFQHTPGEMFCPRTVGVKKYHNVTSGHVVMNTPLTPGELETAREAERVRLTGKCIEEILCHAELLKEEWQTNAAVAMNSLSMIETLTGNLTRLLFSRRA